MFRRWLKAKEGNLLRRRSIIRGEEWTTRSRSQLKMSRSKNTICTTCTRVNRNRKRELFTTQMTHYTPNGQTRHVSSTYFVRKIDKNSQEKVSTSNIKKKLMTTNNWSKHRSTNRSRNTSPSTNNSSFTKLAFRRTSGIEEPRANRSRRAKLSHRPV